MRVKNLFWSLLLLLSNYSNASVPNEISIQSNYSLENCQILEDDGVTKSTFRVNAEQDGYYYLNFWILGAKTLDGKLKTTPKRVNGVEVETVISKTANWHSYHSSKSFFFKKGENVVEFLDVAPHVANVTNLIYMENGNNTNVKK